MNLDGLSVTQANGVYRMLAELEIQHRDRDVDLGADDIYAAIIDELPAKTLADRLAKVEAIRTRIRWDSAGKNGIDMGAGSAGPMLIAALDMLKEAIESYEAGRKPALLGVLPLPSPDEPEA